MRKRLAILYTRGALAVFLILVLAIAPYMLFQNEELFPKFAGMATESFDNSPSIEQQQCMINCAFTGCKSGERECIIVNVEGCFKECDIKGKIEDYSTKDLFGISLE